MLLLRHQPLRKGSWSTQKGLLKEREEIYLRKRKVPTIKEKELHNDTTDTTRIEKYIYLATKVAKNPKIPIRSSSQKRYPFICCI